MSGGTKGKIEVLKGFCLCAVAYVHLVRTVAEAVCSVYTVYAKVKMWIGSSVRIFSEDHQTTSIMHLRQ